jgi:hypothetical protein
MPKHQTRDTVHMGVDINPEIANSFRQFCRQRGETIRQHLEMAIARHMATPPPPPALATLPPAGEVPRSTRGPGRPRKESNGGE